MLIQESEFTYPNLYIVLIYTLLYILKEKMAALSSILPWKIQWTEEPGGLIVHGVTKS